MKHILGTMLSGTLVWFEELGYGYVHPENFEIEYGIDYYREYKNRASNDISDKLMKARNNFVDKYINEKDLVIDIGAGACAFVDSRRSAGKPVYGYDVNPYTIFKLIKNDSFWSPWMHGIPNATFWDVLEHLPNPARILRLVENKIFISIPIFENSKHVLESKHFKKGEHLWYFTDIGLEKYLDKLGFCLIGKSNCETELGREDILSFAFSRKYKI